MQEKHKKAGFTLVELIVVLVILGVLAGILVPTMLGWIRDAKKQEILLLANNVFKVAQVSLIESYAFDGKYSSTVTSNSINFVSPSGTISNINCSHLSNTTFRRAQAGDGPFDKDKDSSKAQYRVAESILKYLGVKKKDYSEFDFRYTSGKSSPTTNIGNYKGKNIKTYPPDRIGVTSVSDIIDNNASILLIWNNNTEGQPEIIYFSFAYNQVEVVYSPKSGIDHLTAYTDGKVLRGLKP